VLAAVQLRRLDLEKQDLKYGLQIEPPGGFMARPAKAKRPDRARTGRSGRGKAPKKAAAKPAAKKIANGRTFRPKARAAQQSAGKSRKTAPRSAAPIVLPPNYRPAESEPFMNERHRIYFRNKLMTWKEEIVRQNRETLHVLHEDSSQHADIADRATSETDRALELRARDRQRKLIAKIDAAISRIEDGSYGYCEETGEPIGLKRLEARPNATLSLEAQERHERREKVFRED
jgi:DnaK suppressor protein